jgi:hypothetical protein
LRGPPSGLCREDVRERAKSAVFLQDGQSFRRNFVGKGFGEKLGLFRSRAALDGRRDTNGFKQVSGVARAKCGIETAKSLDRATTRLPVLPSRGDNNTDDDD